MTSERDDRGTRHGADDAENLPKRQGDPVVEGIGGVSGAAAGAAVGAIGGPVGAIIGAVAGGAAGWWAGRGASEANATWTTDEDEYWREQYEGSSERLADRGYDDIRPAYQLGHIAAQNPDYRERGFEDVEGDLERGWSSHEGAACDWANARKYAHASFNRCREKWTPAARHFSADAPSASSGLMNDATNG